MFVSAIRSVARSGDRDAFPWTVPVIGAFSSLALDCPVTFLMGENGCGKSTFLEAVAIAARAVSIGAKDLGNDPSLAGARRFAETLTIVSRKRPATRVFFRAEDAFGFTRRVETDLAELRAIAGGLRDDERGSASAKRRAAGYVEGQRRTLTSRYGEDPHARSHGETFLQILRERIVPRGLYLLDEPETPLSPVRILALLVLIGDAVRAGSQFVIATHSPILAALPRAAIYVFEGETIRSSPYDEVEHVRVTRDFLNAPERYLRRLDA